MASTQTAPDTLTVDLDVATGPIHGGAAGSLYGVYGPGVPSDAVLAGFYPKTLSTKAQDGVQHPGADALEVVEPFVANGGRDVYIYMADIYRGFPYRREPGQAGRDDYRAKVEAQVRQVVASPYRDHIVYVPFNEPEGNYYGEGEHSYDGVSWLNDPRAFFEEWDLLHDLIKRLDPRARIAGPNTSILYDQVRYFLEHCKANDRLPEVITWHELSSPDRVRTSVAKYRSWERELGIGPLPININEYAFRYHLSVPGQMIQWIAALEESKVDGDLAYWNIDGNLNDSVAEANKANGQWWLFNAYGRMSGDTVQVTPPHPGEQYTLQGVATLDHGKRQARLLFGGADGAADVRFANVDRLLFGDRVHVTVEEIAWTGQLGDSPAPRPLLDAVREVGDDGFVLPFTDLDAMSAYQVIISPAGHGPTAGASTRWRRTYEAEDAAHTGTGWSLSDPEGSADDVSKFATSNLHHVRGLRTGSDVVLSFAVDVPETGDYDIGVFSSSHFKDANVVPHGPTNVFLRVDGEQPRELRLPMSYEWAVWERTDTRVRLDAGAHTITLAASDPLLGSTRGDAAIDKIDLALVDLGSDGWASYEAEYADLRSAEPQYGIEGASGPGIAAVPRGGSVTFWVHAANDGYATVCFDHLGGGQADVALNGHTVEGVIVGTHPGTDIARLFLSAGVNRLTAVGDDGTLLLDRVRVGPADATGVVKVEAKSGQATGAATFSDDFPYASGLVATNIGDGPENALVLDVPAERTGGHVLVIRYANAEESVPTHYNPDLVTQYADISVNGQVHRVAFPNTLHPNQFRDLAVPVDLVAGTNRLTITAPKPEGAAADQFGQRSKYAPAIDYLIVAPLVG
ncbi:hypothetical protein F4560_003331 [Saccharothrix ecbatanensis]|uniref:CBM6 domain-containing protein n=1 Tax=Saccharothrix ecbatanensis TaxID=1105145 RepID=A0A7W9M170_9PSEU|nr:cellulosome protein [Saccharothrix ecbatanensis]MBB5803563.1 hypothetical protein [Saccharothrix ecbatanensis]